MFKKGDRLIFTENNFTGTSFEGRSFEGRSPGDVVTCKRRKGDQVWIDDDTDSWIVDWFELADEQPGEVRITDPVTGGQKGQKLSQLGAVDPRALLAVGEVAGFGAQKYARYNFAKGYKWSLSYDAMQRHLQAFWDGQDNDTESGLSHLAHAAWHCLALLSFVARGRGTDDRFPQ